MDQIGFEEEHACPHCLENYLVWFTRIGNSPRKPAQIVPLTIKPAPENVHSPAYMQDMENTPGLPHPSIPRD